MASVEEVLAQMSSSDVIGSPDYPVQYIIDNDLRIITVPPEGVIIGVEGDKDVNLIKFSMPRYYKKLDLSEFDIRISYVNARAQAGYFKPTDKVIQGDKILFGWVVSDHAAQYIGTVQFAVSLTKLNGSLIDKRFNTTIAKAEVLDGLAFDGEIPETTVKDLLAQILEETMAKITPSINEAKGYAAQAKTSETNAQKSVTQAAQQAKNAQTSASQATQQATNAQKSAEQADTTAKTLTTKVNAATDAANAAANKAEGIIAKLPLPDGNVLRGNAKGELATVDDSFGAPPLSIDILGNTKRNLWINPVGTNEQASIQSGEKGECVVSGVIPSKEMFIVTTESYALVPGKQYVCEVDKLPKNARAGFFIQAKIKNVFTSILGIGVADPALKKIFTYPANATSYRCGFQVSATDITPAGSDISGTYHVMLREATPDEIAQAGKKPATTQEGGTADIQHDHPTFLPADPEIYAEQKPFEWVRPGINGTSLTALNVSGRNLIHGSAFHNVVNSENQIDGDGYITGPGNGLPWGYQSSDLRFSLPAGNFILTVEILKTTTQPALAGFILVTEGNEHLADVVGHSNNVTGVKTYNFALSRSSNVGLQFKPFGARARFAIYSKRDSAGAYSPSVGSSTKIDLKGVKLHRLSEHNTDTIHIDSSGKVTLHRKVMTIDGTQAANAVSAVQPSSGGNKPYAFVSAPNPYPAANTYVQLDCISDKYDNTGGLKKTNAYRTWNGVIIVDDRFTSAEEAKRILKEENPTFCYSIPETKIELGSIELPKFPHGIVNIWTDAEVSPEIDAEYIRDVNIVVNKLEAALIK